MPWDCISCKYQKHVKRQEWRIRHLEQEFKAAREEISRLKAVNVSSSVRKQTNSNNWKQTNSNNWITPKNSKSRCHMFSADDAPLVQLSNRFSVDVGQKSSVLLKHEHKKVKSFAGKSESKRRILLLGNSHGREIGPMLQEKLGIKFDMMSIFKPNATLAKVVEDLGKLGKDLTKQDHIVIVYMCGLMGNN
jgi:hypothetical protein